MERQHEFSRVSVSHVSSSSAGAASPVPVVSACFAADRSGRPQLWFGLPESPSSDIHTDIRTSKLFKLGPKDSLCVSEDSGIEGTTDKTYSKALRIRFETEDICKAFHSSFELWKLKRLGTGTGVFENRSNAILKCKFDNKIEATSAKMYFHYYGQLLLHQLNMLQDYIRTGTYFAAVIENHADFNDRIVVDVGAGSGILSLFAAKLVYDRFQLVPNMFMPLKHQKWQSMLPGLLLEIPLLGIG